MTAATLVPEPIFEADLPPEQYAYRPEPNAQQAAVALLARHPLPSVRILHGYAAVSEPLS
jgi:hypothetical protein